MRVLDRPPPFRDPKPIALEDVLLFDYAYSEELEPSRWNPDAAELATYLARIGGPANLSPEERKLLIGQVSVHREPMLGFLQRNDVQWFEGTFDVDAIGGIRLIRWFQQPQFANARTIDELLKSPGGATYAKLDFRLEAMRGRPILVAPELAGPYCLVEGTHRCCEVVRLSRQGAVPSASLPFVLGVCSKIDEYTPFSGGVVVAGARPWWLPLVEFLHGALLRFGDKTHEGQLVVAVGNAWRRILKAFAQYPGDVLSLSDRDFEQFVAGCYDQDGYSVTLTPRSGDFGRDIIAEKPRVGSVRVLDQVKRYRPGRLVTAEEIRAFLFVAGEDRATKCFITTTANFAPQLMKDPFVSPKIESGFLELRDGEKTVRWLRELERKV